MAISALYDVWREAEGNGRARDIGVGADGSDADTAPDVWVVGMTAQTGGFEVYKWTGTGFQFATGGLGATAISVSPTDGKPWIVSGGRVYERSSTSATSGSWVQRGPNSNCAKDIGAGGNGRAWEIGCTALPGGFNIASYNPSTATWTTQGQPGTQPSAVRIASEVGNAGWVVANDGAVYHNKSGLATDWAFTEGFGIDVGAGPTLAAGKGYAFVTGTNAGQVYVWNEQDATEAEGDEQGNNSSKTFRFFDGNGAQIAVGPDGKPWLVASNNTIWRTTK